MSSPARGRRSAEPSDRGSTTAEFALLMPVIVVLMAAILAAGVAMVTQVRCVDAARAGARVGARHQDPVGTARLAAPGGASVRVSEQGDEMTVEVSADVDLPLPWHPRIVLGSVSTAQVETGADLMAPAPGAP